MASKTKLLLQNDAFTDFCLGRDIGESGRLLQDDVLRWLCGRHTPGSQPEFVGTALNLETRRLMGARYATPTNAPALGTAGDMCYCGMRQFVAGVETDVIVKRSEHLKFGQNRVALSIHMMAGRRLVQPRAGCILSDAS